MSDTNDQVLKIMDGLAHGNPQIINKSVDTEPHGLLPMPCMDLPEFFEEVAKVLDDYQNRLRINQEDRIKLVEEGPPIDLVSQVITYKVITRVPGTVSPARPGVNMGSGHRHEWVPRCRYIIDEPDKPNSKTLVMGQFFDNMIEFTCWAKTNKAANKTAFLFQDLMSHYRFYFHLKGIPEVIFEQRKEDIRMETQTQGNWLKGRPLVYYVKTDRTYSVSENVLRDIVINLGISNS